MIRFAQQTGCKLIQLPLSIWSCLISETDRQHHCFDVAADLVLKVDRLPQAGETLGASSLEFFPGGKGANQAAAAAKLGWPTYLVGQLGTDSNADALQAALQSAGVQLQHVTRVPGPSGTAVILLQNSGAVIQSRVSPLADHPILHSQQVSGQQRCTDTGSMQLLAVLYDSSSEDVASDEHVCVLLQVKTASSLLEVQTKPGLTACPVKL